MSLLSHQGLLSSGSFSYWNPSDKAVNAVLSSNNRIVGGPAGGPKQVRAIKSKNSGSFRVQFKVNNLAINQMGVGGFATSAAFGTFAGSQITEWVLWGPYPTNLVRVYNNAIPGPNFAVGLATNDYFDALINFTLGAIWWRRNNTVISGNPTAGTGAMATFTPGTFLFPESDPFYASNSVELITDPANMQGTSVSGFLDGWSD